MKTSNRILIRISFLGILICLVYLGGLLLEFCANKFDPNEQKVQEIMAFQHKSYDLICLGNSITQAGINPYYLDSILNVNSFNFAVGGATIIENEIFLRHYLANNEKPKFIIVGLYVNERSWGNDLRPSVQYAANRNAKKYYKQYLTDNDLSFQFKENIYNQFAAYRFRNVCEKMMKYMIKGGAREYNYYKGFLYSNIKNKIPKSLNSHQSGINIPALQSFDEFCTEKNIKVIYIELPNSEVFNETTINRLATIEEIKGIIGDNFISFNNDSFFYNDDYWVSLNHLNKEGAENFTKILANAVKPTIHNRFYLTSRNK